MFNSRLPQAKSSEQQIRFGNMVIKSEKPSQSFSDAKKGLEKLERAAKDNVFKENESSE